MGKLDFAFWDSVGYREGAASPADIYEQHLQMAQRIEELGWHSYFVIEHQNSPVGRCTAPTVFLTAVASRTSKLRFGGMIWQLPFYHPLRLAQEVAMLDQLSRGRVEFGTGVGVHEHEFIRWGQDYYQRHEIAEEVLDIVQMAWTQDEVTVDGRFFHFDEALPQPKPYQQPHPPIWTAVHSDSSIENAARHGYNMAKNGDTDDIVSEKFDLFRRVWRESGHTHEPRIFLMRAVHVAETDEKAHEEARPYVATGVERTGGGPIANTRIGWGSNKRGMGRDSEQPDAKRRGEIMQMAVKSYEFNVDNGITIVGSPETVARHIQEVQERMGITLFCTNHQIGGMPNAMVDKSIELFGKEVIPAFQPVLV